MGETVVTSAPLIAGVTNAEVMAAFSCDLILLNEYDVFTRYINGMEGVGEPIKEIKRLTAKPLGINLEPLAVAEESLEDLITLPQGRIACKETFIEAEKQGVDFILLTGNPATGVTNKSIEDSISIAKKYFSGLVFAGNMHGAGLSEKVLSQSQVLAYINEGADGVLLPSAGTIMGVSEEKLSSIADKARSLGAIVIAAIGTSQESSDTDTIRQIALSNKRIGADIQHLGDGGFGRMPDVENIMAMSNTIRGKRHTYNRMSISINR